MVFLGKKALKTSAHYIAVVKLRQMDPSRHYVNRKMERFKDVCMEGTGWNSSRTLLYRKTIRKYV